MRKSRKAKRAERECAIAATLFSAALKARYAAQGDQVDLAEKEYILRRRLFGRAMYRMLDLLEPRECRKHRKEYDKMVGVK